jgi:hypothetical protein
MHPDTQGVKEKHGNTEVRNNQSIYNKQKWIVTEIALQFLSQNSELESNWMPTRNYIAPLNLTENTDWQLNETKISESNGK